MSADTQFAKGPAQDAKPSLTIKRCIKTDPQTLFAAWTEPEKIIQWWGPTGMTGTHAEVDPRQGGRFRFIMKAADGEINDVSGIYKEFVPHEKLVMSWAWITTPERVSQLTLTFKADGDATILTLLHEQFADEAARDGHNKGWTETLDKLEAIYNQNV